MEERPKLTEKPSFYAIIPADVRYDKRLSANAKLLYGEITCLLTFNSKCFASNAYFSRLYELSESQISRLITQLVNCEHINIKLEKKTNGTERIIVLPLRKNAEGGVRKNAQHNKHSINILTISEDIVNADFVKFWDLYGKKIGLKETFKSWNKYTIETHKIILEKLPSWKLQQEDEIKFWPHPATFLNQERWNDELLSKMKVSFSGLTQPQITINHDDRA